MEQRPSVPMWSHQREAWVINGEEFEDPTPEKISLADFFKMRKRDLMGRVKDRSDSVKK